jgi:hypothetical protein
VWVVVGGGCLCKGLRRGMCESPGDRWGVLLLQPVPLCNIELLRPVKLSTLMSDLTQCHT